MILRSSHWWSGLRLAACVGALAALAACGGDVFDPFRPARAVSFGDETSYISATGSKYSINLAEGAGVNCDAWRVWNQIVIEEEYGFSFAQCNRGGRTGNNVALLYAQPGATVADIAQQITNHLATGTLGSTDIVLIQGGANNIWNIFTSNGNAATADAIAQARDQGVALGNQIARLTALGARVLAIDVIFQGSTPKALALGGAATQALNDLTNSFNSGFYSTFPANSRTATYAQANDLVRRMTDPDANRALRFQNWTDPACLTPTAIDCTNGTLKPDVNPSEDAFSYVFADDRFLTPTANRQVGNLARDRAHDHPF